MDMPDLRRGDNLLLLFPSYGKALVFDIEVALTGWPTGRTVLMKPFGAQPVAVRYRVSRHVGGDGVALFWQLQRDEAQCTRDALA